MERARIVEANVGADRRDGVRCVGEPLDSNISPQFILEHLERRAFGGQVAAQGAYGAMQMLGRQIDYGQVGQSRRQVLPHAMANELFTE